MPNPKQEELDRYVERETTERTEVGTLDELDWLVGDGSRVD